MTWRPPEPRWSRSTSPWSPATSPTRPGAPSLLTRGLVSREYLTFEIEDLSAWAWDDFLRANGDPALSTLADVDGDRIWPKQEGELPDRYDGF